LFYQAHICDWSARDDWRRLDPSADAAFSPFTALAFEDDPAGQLRRSSNWAAVHCTKRPACMPAPAEDGRIRIGYFSADFHDHATLYLMAGLLREHDRRRFSIRAYSYGPALGGAMRDHILAHVDGFHEIGAMADTAVMEFARGHGLDIAVDLKGYTQNGRIPIFAHRLAPVQIAFLGYPGSTGVDFMDYLIADPIVVPKDAHGFYSEKLLLLPDSYQPNDNQRAIAANIGSRTGFGLPETGLVFCCFNQTYKISPSEWAIWMRVLERVPGSVLWLLRSNRWAEQNLRREAEAQGIAAERIVFAEPLPQAEHLARIRHADLFLDTFNVNAHTTASDALWAGVPVVTKAGRQFAARVGASLLSAIGLPELVTETEADYEALILALAAQPAHLAAIKARLADNRLTHPLFDTALYARRIEDAFAAAHERHIKGLPPVPISVA
jgi:predicted O-linked N-acetylglucosamine transferase (SPINDLY family)